MPYIPHTEADRQAMLKTIGVASIDDLFCEIDPAIVPVRAPGKAARAMREGANLSPDRAVGHRTWEDFLAASV